MAIYLQEVFGTLAHASVYMLVAAGFSIVFGVSRIVNIAAGDLLTVGAYTAFVVAPGGAIAFVWGFGAAAVAVGVLCVVLERALFSFTLARPVNGFLISLGLVTVIENLLAYAFASRPAHPAPASATVFSLHGAEIPADTIIVIAGTIAIMAALMVVLERTRLGLSIRAVSTDRETAALMGAPVTRLVAVVFGLAGLLAGAGGAFIALLGPASPYLGLGLMVKGFLVALAGGLGSVRGALVGALVLASLETVVLWSFVWFGAAGWLDVIEFGAVVVLLMVRPHGLVGGAGRAV